MCPRALVIVTLTPTTSQPTDDMEESAGTSSRQHTALASLLVLCAVRTLGHESSRVFSSSAAPHRVAVDEQLNIPGELRVSLVKLSPPQRAL